MAVNANTFYLKAFGGGGLSIPKRAAGGADRKPEATAAVANSVEAGWSAALLGTIVVVADSVRPEGHAAHPANVQQPIILPSEATASKGLPHLISDTYLDKRVSSLPGAPPSFAQPSTASSVSTFSAEARSPFRQSTLSDSHPAPTNSSSSASSSMDFCVPAAVIDCLPPPPAAPAIAVEVSAAPSQNHRHKPGQEVAAGAAEGEVTDGGTQVPVPAEADDGGIPTAAMQHVAAPAARCTGCRDITEFPQLKALGEGTYGTVTCSRHPETGKLVALKKLKMPPDDSKDLGGVPLFVIREIRALRALRGHPNIVSLEEMVTSRPSAKNRHRGEVFMAFEYAEHDLAGLISTPEFDLSLQLVRCYMHQLLSGLAHAHAAGWVHRDVKTANVLLTAGHGVKLADFGLARNMNIGPRQMTHEVVTLWYRAPELLFGDPACGTGVDVWSAGCVFAELMLREPLFTGNCNVQQIRQIYRLCGAPEAATWPGLTALTNYKLLLPRAQHQPQFKHRFKSWPPLALDLLTRLLTLSPHQRPSAAEALKHPFFLEGDGVLPPSSFPPIPLESCHELEAKQRRHNTHRGGGAGGGGGGAAAGAGAAAATRRHEGSDALLDAAGLEAAADVTDDRDAQTAAAARAAPRPPAAMPVFRVHTSTIGAVPGPQAVAGAVEIDLKAFVEGDDEAVRMPMHAGGAPAAGAKRRFGALLAADGGAMAVASEVAPPAKRATAAAGAAGAGAGVKALLNKVKAAAAAPPLSAAGPAAAAAASLATSALVAAAPVAAAAPLAGAALTASFSATAIATTAALSLVCSGAQQQQQRPSALASLLAKARGKV